MSSATTCGNRSGPSRTPFRSWLKSVRLPPGILFAFIPESCSTSTRNAVRLHRGNLFALARNPHLVRRQPIPDAHAVLLYALDPSDSRGKIGAQKPAVGSFVRQSANRGKAQVDRG